MLEMPSLYEIIFVKEVTEQQYNLLLTGQISITDILFRGDSKRLEALFGRHGGGNGFHLASTQVKAPGDDYRHPGKSNIGVQVKGPASADGDHLMASSTAKHHKRVERTKATIARRLLRSVRVNQVVTLLTVLLLVIAPLMMFGRVDVPDAVKDDLDTLRDNLLGLKMMVEGSWDQLHSKSKYAGMTSDGIDFPISKYFSQNASDCYGGRSLALNPSGRQCPLEFDYKSSDNQHCKRLELIDVILGRLEAEDDVLAAGA